MKEKLARLVMSTAWGGIVTKNCPEILDKDFNMSTSSPTSPYPSLTELCETSQHKSDPHFWGPGRSRTWKLFLDGSTDARLDGDPGKSEAGSTSWAPCHLPQVPRSWAVFCVEAVTMILLVLHHNEKIGAQCDAVIRPSLKSNAPETSDGDIFLPVTAHCSNINVIQKLLAESKTEKSHSA